MKFRQFVYSIYYFDNATAYLDRCLETKKATSDEPVAKRMFFPLFLSTGQIAHKMLKY